MAWSLSWHILANSGKKSSLPDVLHEEFLMTCWNEDNRGNRKLMFSCHPYGRQEGQSFSRDW